MSEEIILRKAGEVLDREPRLGRPVAVLLYGVLALLVIDLLLALALGQIDGPGDREPRDRHELRDLLEDAGEDERPWLLIGDSVMAGNVMEGQVEDWQHQRVVDHLRRERSPHSAETFHQVALDGLLPVDMLRIVEELDRSDPSAKVSVAIEINLRHFSPHYAEQSTCSRSWLCELDPVVDADGAFDALAWLHSVGWNIDHELGHVTPIYRHRARLDQPGAVVDVPGMVVTTSAPARGDEVSRGVAARASLREHYREPELVPGRSRQADAMRQIVGRLRASGRRALFFTTPIEDRFMAEAMPDPASYGAYISAVSRLLGDGEAPNIEVANLDHPLFVSAYFLDHVHLGADGNRLLAINLLHEMNIGLASTPPAADLIHLEDSDFTMIHRVDAGYAEGAAWQALTSLPEGISVQRGGDRIAFADTGNHVLRVLDGSQQTTHLLAGIPGRSGHRDGPALAAELDHPTSPCWAGDTLYFASDRGASLRRLDGGVVETVELASPLEFQAIASIRCDEQVVYLLVDQGAILAYEPTTFAVTVVVRTDAGAQIRAFDVSPAGQIFVADHRSQIWTGRVDDGRHRVLRTDGTVGLEMEFANAGEDYFPDDISTYFPFDYDQVHFDRITDLRYVERYAGLLVQDLARQNKKIYKKGRVTERVHLRFLALADDRVYPWVKPQLHGSAYTMYNTRADALVSPFHIGSLDLDQETASLYYIERHRSRLFVINDGLYGLTKVGGLSLSGGEYGMEIRELYGSYAGAMAMNEFRTDRHLGNRTERLERAGPYQVLILTGSVSSVTDRVGQYSMVRRIGEALSAQFGLRDGIRTETIQRSFGGVRFHDLVDTFEENVRGGTPDVAIFEIQDSRGGFRTNGAKTAEEAAALLARIRRLAAVHDTLVLFYDNTGAVSRQRDGLRPAEGGVNELIDVIEASGFEVVQPSDSLLQDHLARAPWGTAPFAYNHPATWAIDVTGDRVASWLYPRVRAHLEGRVPAWSRPWVERPERGADRTLASVFDDLDLASSNRGLVEVGLGTLLMEVSDGHAQVFADLDRLGIGDDPDAEQAQDLALAVAKAAATGNPGIGRAKRISIRLARFTNRDEYGSGVRESAHVLFDETFDRAALEAFARARLAAD